MLKSFSKTLKIKTMKKTNLFTVILLLFVSSLSAQNNIFTSFGVGLTVPISDFESSYKTGLNLGANAGMTIDKMFGGRVDLQYHSLPYKNSSIGSIEFTGDAFTIVTFGADVVISDFGKIKKKDVIIPYGFAGLSYLYAKAGDFKYGGLTITTESESKLALGIGGGALYKFSENIGISAELKYSVTLGGEQVNYIPLRVSLSYIP